MVGMLAAALGAWIFGRWGSLNRSAWTRRIAAIAAIALIGIGGVHAAAKPEQHTWEDYTAEKVSELHQQGRPIFVDFTASWCVTCQYNKRLVLHTDEVQEAFRDKGVTLLQADWSEQPEAITRALASFGRSGVPLYLLYGAEPGAAPRILPELLTKGIVMDALQDLP
jgi:thiol:disulfide interchange protein DsbD